MTSREKQAEKELRNGLVRLLDLQIDALDRAIIIAKEIEATPEFATLVGKTSGCETYGKDRLDR